MEQAQAQIFWNITQESAALSAVTGVLAGFVFTGIILVLSTLSSRRGKQKASNALLNLLIISLLSLMFSSILYALTTGFSQAEPEIYICSMSALFVFVLGSALITLSIGYLLKEYGVTGSPLATSDIMLQGVLAFTTLGILRMLFDVKTVLTDKSWPEFYLLIIFVVVAITHVCTRLRRTGLAASRAIRFVGKHLIWCSYSVVMSAVVLAMLVRAHATHVPTLVIASSLLFIAVQVCFIGCQTRFITLRAPTPQNETKKPSPTL